MGIRNAPLAWLFAAAWLGCWLGKSPIVRAVGPHLWWTAAVVALIGICAAAAGRLAKSRMPLIALAAALACAASVSARLTYHQRLDVQVTRGDQGVFSGRLIDATASSYKGLSLRLSPDDAPGVADVELIASAGEAARALTRFPADQDGRIEWPLRLYPYRAPGNPWEFDRRMWAAEHGLVARAYFADPIADPVWLETGPPGCLAIDALYEGLSPVRRLAWRWRCELHRSLPEDQAQVAQAIVLGQKDLLDAGIREAFSQAGIAHLLAVSGVHVGFVAMAALAMLGPMVRSSRSPWWRALGIGAGTVAIGVYVLLVGGPPSAMRAGVMSVAAFLARVVGRRSDSFQTLGAAGLALLLADPLYGFDLGFQLSFGATVGIMAAVRVCRRALGGLLGIRRTLTWSLVMSLAALAFTLPASVGAFSVLPWMSPLVNVVAIPVGALSILAIGGGLVVGEISRVAGSLLITVGGYGIELLIAMARAVAPWASIEVPAPSRLFSVGWYALLAGTIQSTASYMRESSARSMIWGRWLVAVGAGLVACSSLSGLVANIKGDVKVVVFDVGQGDSILILGPWGRSVLVDGGPAAAGGYDAGAHRVVPALKRLGVRTLDAVISTHPDSDHVGGLGEVLRQRDVRSVFASWAESDTAAYRRFTEAARAKGIEILRFGAGDTLQLGSHAAIAVLGSGNLMEWRGIKGGAPTVNDRSVALALENGSSRFLLLGDTEDRGAARLMEQYDLAAGGLMIPHHGSPGDFWEAFLDRIAPELAAISVGPNGFGHPSRELMEILAARGVKTARTDRCGAITIELRRTGMALRSHRASECRFLD